MATPRPIKTLLMAAEGELGVPISTAFYGGGADDTGKQLSYLANRTLDWMRRDYDWATLQFEYNIVVNAPLVTTASCSLAKQSAVITNIPDTSSLAATFWAVKGPGIPQAARILSVDSPTQITMTMENTNTSALTSQIVTFAKDTYPLPADFDWYSNGTMWDRTNFWKLLGPDSPQRDQWLRSGITPLTPRRHWRQIGPYLNQFRLWPPPTEIVNPLQLVLEYESAYAVAVNGSTTAFAKYFVNDTDTCLLDEDAIIQGVKWMFWEIKGFGSYITMQNRWADYVARLAARDAGAPTLNMSQRETALLISPANVQDGNFPAPPTTS